jgi:nitroreductase
MSHARIHPHDTVLAEAVAVAVRAPSIHNSQPWRFRVGHGRIEIHADRSRQLTVVDTTGRALLVSCGAALFQARIALQAAGWDVSVERMPDPDDRDHLATVRVTGPTTMDTAGLEAARRLAAAARERRTDRRPFADRPVEPETVDVLVAAVAAEGAMLKPVIERSDRLDLIVAVGRADELELTNPAYLAEMRRWSGRPEDASEGVPVTAVPHLEQRQSDVEIRDFEVGATGTLPATAPEQVERAAMFILATDTDSDEQQLRAGEAVAHVLLTATELGLTASPYTQPLEVVGTVSLLRTILGGVGEPQIVFRVGWPGPGSLPPQTGRRPLEDVIDHLP